MKLLITFFISIVTISLLAACNNGSGSGLSHIDSTLNKRQLVLALLDTGAAGKPNFKIDVVYRLIKDSVKLIEVDESIFKKMASKDTSYYFLYTGPVQDKDGNKLKSIAGKDSIRSWWVGIDKHRIVLDGGNIDSAIAKYK